MFLHVLLFFLLGTSVLGAPAKRPTEVAQAAGGHPQPVVEALAQKLHVGLWHPIKAGVGINVPPELVMEIPPSEDIRLRVIDVENGAIQNDLWYAFTTENARSYDSRHIKYWGLFPTNTTEFEALLHCLTLIDDDEGRSFGTHVIHKCDWPVRRPITKWASSGFNYWYQVPGPGSSNPHFVSAPVLQFDRHGQVVGIHLLGPNGGVDLSHIIPHHDLNFHAIAGRYRRVPNPGVLVALRSDVMDIKVEEILGHTIHTIAVTRGYDSIRSWYEDDDR